MSELTHLDSSGRARMVDVGAKPHTERVAVARANEPTSSLAHAAPSRWSASSRAASQASGS